MIHVTYCVIVLVTIPDNLFTIMLPVYFATLPDTCYTSCGDILFMYMYILHCMPFVSVYPIDNIPVYTHRNRMVAYFITCSHASRQQCLLYIKLETIVDMTR